MDYNKLSDFEINKRVFNIVMSGRSWDKQGKSSFDYCNNPADAWPIMLESKISIMWQTAEESWCAWANGDLEEGCWDWKYCPDDYHVHSSALRAAMIVFLMLQ